MAISSTLPGVTIKVCANGEDLHEYEDSETSDSTSADTVIRYIEAVTDQTFNIRIDAAAGVKYRGDALSFDIHVDGHVRDYPFLWKTKSAAWQTSEGVILPGNLVRKYKFDNLEKRETMHGAKDKAKFDELGTIKVVVHHDRIKGKAVSTGKTEIDLGIGPVSEKDVKGQAVSHTVGFGPAKKEKYAAAVWKTEWLDPLKRPDAVYVFRYRSREALKSELIVPRTPSPEPEIPLEDRPLENLTWEELLELARRSQTSQREREDSVKVKREEREGSPRRRKARQSGDITTIELDEDGKVIGETSVPRARGPSVELDD